jgi:hypothetical protein
MVTDGAVVDPSERGWTVLIIDIHCDDRSAD